MKGVFYMKTSYKKYDCDSKKDTKCAPCEPKHPCPQGVILKCCPASGSITLTGAPTTTITSPMPIANVTVDTTCLCSPMVKIDFSSIITFRTTVPANDASADLMFRLSKTCDSGNTIGLGTWTFERRYDLSETTTIALSTSDSFNFTLCECGACSECCTYTVELVSGVVNSSTVTVGSATLSVIATAVGCE